MLLENPCSFVDREGRKKNLTKIEYIIKVAGLYFLVVTRLMMSVLLLAYSRRKIDLRHEYVTLEICDTIKNN